MPDHRSLKHLQHRFQDYLTGDNEAFINDITSTQDALAEHRLGAYYNAYRLRLIDCLATDYKGLQAYLGEQNFEYLVLDYLKAHPSKHPSVRWVGSHMADFLAQSPHSEAEFLSELALFEWAQGLCFDAAESPHFSIEEMVTIAPDDWPGMRFEFQPSVRWLDLHYNIPPIWQALTEQQEAAKPQREAIPTRWLIWRLDRGPHWRSLDVAEAWALQQAAGHASFTELCEGLLEWHGEDAVAMAAAGFLKQWIHDDMIARIELDARH